MPEAEPYTFWLTVLAVHNWHRRDTSLSKPARKNAPVVFQVLDATAWELVGHERRGVTEHEWFRHPSNDSLYLWKPSTGRRADRREHWAEKIASELARLVGVPYRGTGHPPTN